MNGEFLIKKDDSRLLPFGRTRTVITAGIKTGMPECDRRYDEIPGKREGRS